MKNIQHFLGYLGKWIERTKGVQWLQRQHPDMYQFIRHRFIWSRFKGIWLTGLLGLLVVNGMIFSEIAENIVNSEPMVKIDQQVTLFLSNHRLPIMSKMFFGLTQLASQVVSIGLTLLIGVILIWQRKYWLALNFACVMAGVGGSIYYGKQFFHRVRPMEVAYYKASTFSFPSGHSTTAMALYGFITYLLVRNLKNSRQRLIVALLGTLLILCIGFSRIYLGMHFLSDVMGGYLVGASWLIGSTIWIEWKQD